MKKTTFTLVIISLLLISSKMFAQDDAAELKNFRFGLKVQPSLDWYKPNDIKKFESGGSSLKFSYGLITEFRLNKIACFSTGLEINSMGGILNYKDYAYYRPSDDTNKFVVASRNFKAFYVVIPLTLKMKTPEIGSITYFGQFGFDASVRWSAKISDKGHFQNSATEVSQDITDKAKNELGLVQLGLNVGLGFEMNLAGTTSLTMSANYHNGFTNALRSESKILKDVNDAAVKQNVLSKGISLTLGVLF